MHDQVDDKVLRFPVERRGEEPSDAEVEDAVATLGLLASHLLTVPELPGAAPRDQLFEFSALAGLAAAYGPDLLRNPEPYERVARAYLQRWHAEH